MKKISFTIILLFLITFTSYAQQGINTMIDLGDLAVKTTHSHNEWLDPGKNSTIREACICLMISVQVALF